MAELIDKKKWAPVVGRFMLAFGSIESSVNNILQQWCSLQTLLFLRTLTLEHRIRLLRELATEHAFGDGNREVLLQNLSDVTSLAKTRNLIAHSPLTLAIFDREDPSSALQEVILSERDAVKHVTFEALSGLTAQAEALADVMLQNRVSIGMHGKELFGTTDGPYQAELERPTKS